MKRAQGGILFDERLLDTNKVSYWLEKREIYSFFFFFFGWFQKLNHFVVFFFNIITLLT